MSRQIKLGIFVSLLFKLLFGLAYTAFYYGIPLFFKRQLPEYLRVGDVSVFAWQKEIVLKQIILQNPETCPNEALLFFPKMRIQVIPEEVRIKSLVAEKGEFHVESLERCGLPKITKTPKADSLVNWDDFFISLKEVLLLGYGLNFETVELHIKRENEKYLLQEIKIKAKDVLGGYHIITADGHFYLKENIYSPNFQGKLESFYKEMSKIVSQNWPNLAIPDGELRFTGKFWLKNDDLAIQGFLILPKMDVLAVISSDLKQKELILPLQIRHSVKEKLNSLKKKIEAELRVQIQKKMEKKFEELIKKFLQPHIP